MRVETSIHRLAMRGPWLWCIATLAGACGSDSAGNMGIVAPIEASRLAVLGDEAGGGGVGPYFTLAESPTGGWLVSYLDAGDEIMVFAPTGEYLRSVGRRGEGPGEFRFIQHLQVSKSLVHVLDAGQRRWARLTPDLEWMDSTPLEFEGSSFIVLDDTIAVVNARSLRYGASGQVVRAVAWGGSKRSGYGDTLDLTDPLVNAGAGRVLAPGRDGRSLWVGHMNRYRIEHWAASGELLGVIERRVDWFPPSSGTYLPTPDEAPPPQIVGAGQDADGLLWVTIEVADADWAEGVVRSPIPEGTGYQVGDRNRFVDTVVEVIDPGTEELVASSRFDAAFRSITAGQVAVYREDDVGVPEIEILALTLGHR